MNHLTGNQIAAARALLGWDQKKVAERIGLSVAAISKIEKGENKGKAVTLEKIQVVFEFAGIEFTEGEGVRKKQQYIRIFKGRDEFIRFYDDIYETALRLHPDPNICIINAKEKEYTHWLGDYTQVHMDRMAKLKGSLLRVLTKVNDLYAPASHYCDYRWITEMQFGETSLYIYGDKTAFVQFGDDNVSVTLVENESVTSTMRKMFEAVWLTALKYKAGI